MVELELALLRRGVNERRASRPACAGCGRTPLIGERVYLAGAARMLCALCRAREADEPIHWIQVHGPEFGHTLRILGQRAA